MRNTTHGTHARNKRACSSMANRRVRSCRTSARRRRGRRRCNRPARATWPCHSPCPARDTVEGVGPKLGPSASRLCQRQSPRARGWVGGAAGRGGVSHKRGVRQAAEARLHDLLVDRPLVLIPVAPACAAGGAGPGVSAARRGCGMPAEHVRRLEEGKGTASAQVARGARESAGAWKSARNTHPSAACEPGRYPRPWPRSRTRPRPRCGA